MAPIDATAGALFDGATISALLYGVSCAQVIKYYTAFPRDSWKIKLMVAVVWLMDTVQQALLSHAAWYYASRRCATLTGSNCEFWAWSVLAEAVPSIVAISIVEGFYIMRIWYFGNKKSAMILTMPAVIAPAYAVTDIGIASTLCYFLWSSRHVVSDASKTLISVLINYAVATGLLTSLIMLTYLVTFIMLAGNMIFLAVYFVGTKVYVNSLLAALNNREALRARYEYGDHVEL
ncbi:hypothetical protein OE88DRAFT_1270209 [Heliocybe sulcata]|uniref:DUF6534 domain-containing protein n=1 Tax=Heliocybe sulcata TaxID=5364 RepID=A0A5C3N9D6_9AGAM|nr:hypothetical protein OE88DRAFT_1270209 [Heliocybe sulcata]